MALGVSQRRKAKAMTVLFLTCIYCEESIPGGSEEGFCSAECRELELWELTAETMAADKLHDECPCDRPTAEDLLDHYRDEAMHANGLPEGVPF